MKEYEYSPRNLSPKKFSGRLLVLVDGERFKFDPKPDMTPIESCQIMQLVLTLFAGGPGYEKGSIYEWMQTSGIARHFSKAEEQ